MNKKCKIKKCQLTPIRNDKCVLHCEKYDYSTDYEESLLLQNFYSELANYLKIYRHNESLIPLSDKEKNWENSDIYFHNINFPERKDRDYFDYYKLLKKIKSAHFYKCHFSNSGINIPNLKLFYDDCIFERYWSIHDCNVLENNKNTLYQDCLFKNEVSIINQNTTNNKSHSIFTNCNFHYSLNIENSRIEKNLFKNTENNIKIKTLNIKDSTFESKLTLNKCNIETFFTENVSFNEKFEFKQNEVKIFSIFNTNFHKIFDAYETNFDEYISKKCIFSDFSGFEKCCFSKESKKVASFEYITHLGFVNFRNAIFYGGLNLENTNLKEPPNFLKIKIESNNTNRETFRIIKNAFDKSGNHIEANKYFSLEMQEYKKELSLEPFSQEKIIFWFNKNISNFGIDYVRPIVLIIIFSIAFELLKLGYEYNILYKIYPTLNPYIQSISNFINNLALNIMPFKRFLYEGMEFISLIFYIIFASLTWQTIVSIKKHTRSS